MRTEGLKTAAVYVRVSTSKKSRRGEEIAFDQNPEVQEQPLRDLIVQRGWQLHRIYTDRASGRVYRGLCSKRQHQQPGTREPKIAYGNAPYCRQWGRP